MRPRRIASRNGRAEKPLTAAIGAVIGGLILSVMDAILSVGQLAP